MAKLLGGSQIYGNATVNSYLVVSGNADLSGGNVFIGNANPVVSSIQVSAAGTGYTSNPTITVSAPTTLYGGTATANANIGVVSVSTINNGGTGYAVNNVLTMVGTANAVSNATFTVTSVSSGVITGVSVATPGVYFSSNTTSPVTVTGGAGTGATLTVAYGVNPPTVTYAGTGYVERPTVTITGGGGSGATAYATVGGPGNIFALGNTLSFSTPSGEAFRITDVVGANRYVSISAGQAGVSAPGIGTGGGGEAFDIFASSNSIRFSTGGAKVSSPQVLITHTAPVSNYLTLTGAATGSGPVVSVGGNDTNADLNLSGKGTGNTKTAGNLVVGGNLYVLGNTTSVNYETVTYTETASVLTTTGNMNVGANLNVTGNVYGGGVRSTTSSTPPASPVVGDVWYNSATDTIYRYTQDSTSSYWLNIFGPTISSNSATVTAGSTYSNSNVASYLVTNTGNIAAGNITAAGTIQYGSGQGGLVFRTLAGGTGAAIYNTNVVPSAQNYAMTTDGASVTFNAPTGGGIYSGINNTIVTTVQAGNLSVTGNVIQTGYQVINSNIGVTALQVTGTATRGGAGYHDFLSATNLGSGVTNPTKWFRVNNTGNLQIVNSAYSATILDLSDSGLLTTTPAPGGSGGSTATLGYLGVPQNSQSSGYTLALSDMGKHVYVTATSTVTIPANGTVAFPIGSTITIISAASVTTTVAITTDTLILAGQGTTGSRTIAPYGMATLIKVTSTSWYISGLGVS